MGRRGPLPAQAQQLLARLPPGCVQELCPQPVPRSPNRKRVNACWQGLGPSDPDAGLTGVWELCPGGGGGPPGEGRREMRTRGDKTGTEVASLHLGSQAGPGLRPHCAWKLFLRTVGGTQRKQGDILGEPGRRARSLGSSSAPDLGRFRLDWLCLVEPPAPPGASQAQPCRVGERTGELVSRPQPFLIHEEMALCVCVRVCVHARLLQLHFSGKHFRAAGFFLHPKTSEWRVETRSPHRGLRNGRTPAPCVL